MIKYSKEDFNNIEFTKGKRDLVKDFKLAQKLKQIECIAFDLDGTLQDSIGQIVSCTKEVFALYNLAQPSYEKIVSMIGMALNEGLEYILDDEHKHLSEAITKSYRELYKQSNYLNQIKLFDNTKPLLQAIKDRGLKIAYASGKSRVGIQRALDNSILGDYVDAFFPGDECLSKPDSQMMDKLRDHFNLKPWQILGVGDSGLDIYMFKNAQNLSLGVQTGVWSGDGLLAINTDFILPKACDLINYLD